MRLIISPDWVFFVCLLPFFNMAAGVNTKLCHRVMFAFHRGVIAALLTPAPRLEQ